MGEILRKVFKEFVEPETFVEGFRRSNILNLYTADHHHRLLVDLLCNHVTVEVPYVARVGIALCISHHPDRL